MAPIATLSASGIIYSHLDRLGTPTVLSGSGVYRTQPQQNEYLPYGEGNPVATGFGLAGYRYDPESKTYHAGARDYDPAQARFLQPDPIGTKGGLNIYAYVTNDPLNLVDPSGLAQVDIAYRQIGSQFGVPYYHAYVVATDLNGQKYVYRAGPSGVGPADGSDALGYVISPAKTVQDDAYGAVVATSGSLAIRAKSIPDARGRYFGGTGTQAQPTQNIISENLPAAAYNGRLTQIVESVNKAGVPYNPTTTNSNSFAFDAAQAASGVRPNRQYFAPGSGNSLLPPTSMQPVYRSPDGGKS